MGLSNRVVSEIVFKQGDKGELLALEDPRRPNMSFTL